MIEGNEKASLQNNFDFKCKSDILIDEWSTLVYRSMYDVKSNLQWLSSTDCAGDAQDLYSLKNVGIIIRNQVGFAI